MLEGAKYCDVCKKEIADEESSKTEREGIYEYICNIYDDFEKYLKANNSLCDLRSITFESNCFPDYSNVHIQQLYLLRFVYAYAFEYRLMYTKLFASYTVGSNLAVTSIGCGNMIDYWALTQALKETKNARCAINYTGIDLIDWKYKADHRALDNVEFIQADAVRFFKERNSLDSDIYFFPKSISEFEDDNFSELCNCFKTKPIVKDKFCVLISIRPVDKWVRRDINRSEELINAIRANGFNTTDEPIKYFSHSNPDEHIYKIDEKFIYPIQIIDTMNNIKDMCTSKMSKPECRDGKCDKMDRSPMLKAKYVQFQMLTFYREKRK